MKRFLVTILSVLYMAGALSLTVHMHYCMGKLASVSFIHAEDDQCGKCGMTKTEKSKKGCCKDDHKTIKTNDHQQSNVSFDFSNDLIAIAPHSPYPLFLVSAILHTPGKVNLANAPPSVWRTCPIYVLNQNYRI